MLDPKLARYAALDAARCVILAAQSLVDAPSVVEIATEGIKVTIQMAGPVPAAAGSARSGRAAGPGGTAGPPPLTPCERDLLDLLARAPMPWTTTRILAELGAAGLEHGESTVRHALARLVAAGLLLNSRSVPRGYSLAPAQPSLAADTRSNLAS